MSTKTPPAPGSHDVNDPNWLKKGDGAGYFPTLESAKVYAEGVANNDYHKDRLRALTHLVKPLVNANSSGNPKFKFNPNSFTALDFGIGDGGQFYKMGLKPTKIIGIDISPEVLALAAENLSTLEFESHCGSAEVLKDVKSSSVDLALCINTLGYLSAEDQELFYEEMKRTVRPGGFLVMMAGNELFDLFALNSGTAEFFERYFDQPDVSKLLLEAGSERFRNADRLNPLKFTAVLQRYGFNEVGRTFSQWHRKLPPIANMEYGGDLLKARAASRDHNFDPNTLPAEDKWRALFQCSIFASLSVKEGA